MASITAEAQPDGDVEKHVNVQSRGDLAAIGRFEQDLPHAYQCSTAAFAGRLGGQQVAVVNRNDPRYAELLKATPDAAPYMTLSEQFDLRSFRTIGLWKAAAAEGMGTLMLTYLTVYANLSPDTIPTQPNAQFGAFDNAAFIGPVVGGLINFLALTLFTFSFGGISGAHLNPTITIATFCARLCSLPRATLYVSAQLAGAALAGLLVRASWGARTFKVGGCWLFDDVVPVKDAFTVEFVCTTTLLFFAFGVGLDPRQRQTVGPTLAPFLVGIALATLSLGSSYTRYGYGGASMNPARCFGAFVGSSFPGWYWYHWVADLIACGLHACFYLLAPPWEKHGQ